MPSGLAHSVSVLAAAVVLLFFRLYLLPENGPPDFDTIANWQVAQEIASGNFSRLFHHRAPLFNLFFGFAALFTTKLKLLIAVNALLNVASVLLLCQLVRRYLQLGALLHVILVLSTGLCVFLVHTSRYLTIESASLPFFALFLAAYVQRCKRQEVKYWYRALVWLVIGLSINYKFVLVLPVLVFLELLNPKPYLKGKPLIIGLGILLMPVLLWSMAAVFAGLPWYRFLGAYAGVTRFNVPNAAMRTGKFQRDVSFYFQYLFRFESPLVWAGLIGYPLLFKPWQYLRKQPLQLPDVLAVFCFAFLAGMSVLLKAPRGLVFVYGPMYLLGFLALHRLIGHKKWLLNSLLVAGILYSAFLCWQHIFRFSGNGYAQMAAELRKYKIQNAAQAVGNGLVPFQADLQGQIQSVSREEELQAAREAGVKWLVLDGYYLATNITAFSRFEKVKPRLAINEPGLISPLFFLEHAEFTGLGFTQTMQLRQKALQRDAQIYLLEMP